MSAMSAMRVGSGVGGVAPAKAVRIETRDRVPGRLAEGAAGLLRERLRLVGLVDQSRHDDRSEVASGGGVVGRWIGLADPDARWWAVDMSYLDGTGQVVRTAEIVRSEACPVGRYSSRVVRGPFLTQAEAEFEARRGGADTVVDRAMLERSRARQMAELGVV